MSGKVLLGAVIGAHGIRGEVKVKTFTEAVENLGAYGALTTEDGRELTIAALRPANNGEAIVRFENIATRSDAESLKGQGLYIGREAMPDPDEGEYYLADLIGLKVEDEAGAGLGKVIAFHNFGAGDMLEIENAAGETIFLPFADDFVPVVDLAGGRIVAVLPREEGH